MSALYALFAAEPTQEVRKRVEANHTLYRYCHMCHSHAHSWLDCPEWCCRCGAKGHSSPQCTLTYQDVRCGHCKRQGHVSTTCMWWILGSEGRKKDRQSAVPRRREARPLAKQAMTPAAGDEAAVLQTENNSTLFQKVMQETKKRERESNNLHRASLRIQKKMTQILQDIGGRGEEKSESKKRQGRDQQRGHGGDRRRPDRRDRRGRGDRRKGDSRGAPGNERDGKRASSQPANSRPSN